MTVVLELLPATVPSGLVITVVSLWVVPPKRLSWVVSVWGDRAAGEACGCGQDEGQKQTGECT